MEEQHINDERDFQNKLAIRNQLVMLLIATAGGTVWLISLPKSWTHAVLIAVGVFFIISLVKNIMFINYKIDKICKK